MPWPARPQHLGQLNPVGVQLGRHLEPEPPQRPRDVTSVVVRVRQPPDVGVGAVAHDQRHPAGGQHHRGDREDDERHNRHDERPQNSHRVHPSSSASYPEPAAVKLTDPPFIGRWSTYPDV